jgi:hypothetical protein
LWIKSFERVIDPNNSTKEMLGIQSSPRRCRFCRNTAPSVTFRKEAHVVPQALGNRSLLSWEECDSCNEAGSLFENDLVSVLSGSRLTAMTRSKRPAVTYKPRGDAYVTATPSAPKILISPSLADDSVSLRRTERGYRVRIKIPKYRPENVVKALARMAYFMMPKELLDDSEHIRRWLLSEEQWLLPWFAIEPAVRGLGALSVAIFQVFVPSESAGPNFPAFDIKFAYGCLTSITNPL